MKHKDYHLCHCHHQEKQFPSDSYQSYHQQQHSNHHYCYFYRHHHHHHSHRHHSHHPLYCNGKILLSYFIITLILISQIDHVIGQNDYYDDLMANVVGASNGDVEISSNGQQQNNNNNVNNMIASSTKLDSLDVICGKEYMTVRAEFNGQFNGIIFSKGTYGQSKCVYVKPHSSLTHTTFNVRYDECGTKPDLQGKYFENTIVIQYGTDIIEAYDEAKRLRCEWFEAYEKPATFRPAIPVADLDIIEMNFQGDEIDCWMSIQEGKGPWSNEINRIVTVGQPLTIVVAINDKKNQFDMKVKSCFAHDGIRAPIYLIDEDGCILRTKMIAPFQKIRGLKGKASLISYAQFLAFKFPDSVDVQIQCTVEVCRHGCIDTCNDGISGNPQSQQQQQHQQPRNHQDHHRNDYHKETIFKIENVTSHRFLMDNNKDDLLESADSNKQPVTSNVLSDVHIINNNNNDDDKNIQSMIDEINDNNDENGKRNYLDIIADYLHNVDSNNKDQIIHNDYQVETIMESTSNPIIKSSHDHGHHQPHPQHQQQQPYRQHPTPKQINNIPKKIIQQAPPTPPLQKPYPIPINHHHHHHSEPVAQIMTIPLSPLYSMPMPLTMGPMIQSIHHQQQPSKSNGGGSGLGSLLNPFNSLKLFGNGNNNNNGISGGSSQKKYIPQILSNYFQQKRQPSPSLSSPTSMMMNLPNDNFELLLNSPIPSNGGGNGHRLYRSRRYINDNQGEIGLKKGFQVVTTLDLSFAPNISQDMMQIFEGKPETIVYGLCFSSTYFIYALATALSFLFSTIFVSIFIVCKLERIKVAKKNILC
ncbi:hypothetical protein DERP_011871 [Dermatophagoides pteronyssinus]|uniref:ZP domain-containing protein n=1 Tax=Dermatophagoides pteronyssinus TaxID=6956 RepID=A0ABQ8JRB5_DERPT|nr:hypothetical protein DERP_011871 [Dermatophagoides pteronyssinus]